MNPAQKSRDTVAGRLSVTRSRSAFTLFELILAIALSVTLVALIGTAINLYLARVDGSRTQVEEAQLARSILAMIADDIRATTIYQPQDTSALAAMAASGAFDVDSVDDERGGGRGGGSGGGGGSGDVDDIDAPSSGTPSNGAGMSTGSGFGTSSSGISSSGATGGMGGASDEPPNTMPLGLNGGLTELYVDATRLPRREELFATITGYTNAPTAAQTGAGMGASATTAAGLPQPSDLKSVRYFIRPGEPVDAGSVAATSLSPVAQLRAGGLVRQEIPRRMRVWAEQSGNTALLDSGQALVAPEVVHIEFRYFDGTQVADVWDMVERNSLPLAIEVRLWIAPTGSDLMAGSYDPTSLANNTREYRQTVFLPMAQVANSAAAMGMSGMSSGSASGSSGMSSGSGMGAGSSSSSSSGASFTQP